MHYTISSAMSATKKEVMGLYRRIFRVAREWKGKEGESQYIREEARTLFHKNKDITDHEIVLNKIKEAEMRVELALHYRIPYPRLFYVPRGPGGASSVLKRLPHNPYMDSYSLSEPTTPQNKPIAEEIV